MSSTAEINRANAFRDALTAQVVLPTEEILHRRIPLKRRYRIQSRPGPPRLSGAPAQGRPSSGKLLDIMEMYKAKGET